ncbi:MAG TPA: hypothetical protein VJY43_00375 [Methanocorpusculum sp.]|nr:hypothetical protein [Methanocorpusculum sp.]
MSVQTHVRVFKSVSTVVEGCRPNVLRRTSNIPGENIDAFSGG